MATPEPSIRFKDAVFRAHNPQWAWDPVSGEGARRHGGRFNRIGVAALYTAVSPITAIREASALGQPMQPLTLCQYDVDCDRVLDSRDGAAMRAAELTFADLRCPTWELDVLTSQTARSQAAADQLIAAGYRGILVCSFARGASADEFNVVFWDWSDSPPNQVAVIDTDGRLPQDRSSWS